jgi:hypothetical protein
MNSACNLKIDWASTEAAQYACKNWHYTQKMPNAGVKFGIWENKIFVGVILFGIGAANATNGKKYGLPEKNAIAELVRVAMRRDHQTPVSKCVSIAIKMLKKQSPNLRMLISFADTEQGHHGGIYQAGNWIYTGVSTSDRVFIIKGERKHAKTIHSNKWVQSEEWLKAHVDPNAKIIKTPGKHRYLMPLDAEMKERIIPFSKPYPKRVKDQAASNPDALGSETLTHTLQNLGPTK